MSSAGRSARSSAPASGSELGNGFHRELRAAIDEDAERRLAIPFLQFGQDLRQVGRVLFLQQIEQVGRGANPQQSPDRVQHDVDFSLRHHHVSRRMKIP